MHFLTLLADVAPSAPILSGGGTDALLAGLVGSLGGGGFSVWYGWYVTTKAIPKIVEDHREERKLDREERVSFQTAITQLTNAIGQLPCHGGIPVCRQ